VVIGPKIGLGLVASEHDIETISHIGLILLLFLIGLEIDIKKLRESGPRSWPPACPNSCCASPWDWVSSRFSVTVSPKGATISCTVSLLRHQQHRDRRQITVRKFELDTLAGRITLGILVFQDIWAIIVLGIQPNLANPEILAILFSFAKGGLLVAASLAISKYILPRIFKSIAKIPELVLVSSLGWCFLVCGAASYMGLSLEMGALIAGVAISTFPYNLDVIAKVVNIRDFFVTLFFVALGMQIPNPWRTDAARYGGDRLSFSYRLAFPRDFPGALFPEKRQSRQPAHLDQPFADQRILSRHRGHGILSRAYRGGHPVCRDFHFRDHLHRLDVHD
jgi:predicted Kef-type K+ transport protein